MTDHDPAAPVPFRDDKLSPEDSAAVLTSLEDGTARPTLMPKRINADTPTPERVAELAAGLRQECDFAEAVAKKSCTRPYDVLMARAANRREIADALDALSRTSAPRMFPIQAERGAKPHPLRIPWDIAELAYSVYAARYGTDQSLERLGQRGGFGPGEMDELLPDWRERCDALADLSRERDELRRDRDRACDEGTLLRDALRQAQSLVEFMHDCLTNPAGKEFNGGYEYAYPQRTHDRLEAWAALAPRISGCHHSMIRPDCVSCVENHQERMAVAAARARLAAGQTGGR